MVLYGAGGHAKVVIDILESDGIKIDYIVDDNPRIKELCGYKVRRDVRRYDEVIVAIGSSKLRKDVVDRLSVRKYLTAVDSSATVSARASIGDGSVVMQGAVIQSDTKIGHHCIINTSASVDHDCEIGDFVHVAPHAAVLGGVKIGSGAMIGAGAVIRQNLRVGVGAVVGAGAVVVEDVPDNAVVVGVPAKELMHSSVLQHDRKQICLCLAHLSDEGVEQKYIKEAFDTNWVVPLGPNVSGFESDLKRFINTEGQNRELLGILWKAISTIAERRVVICISDTWIETYALNHRLGIKPLHLRISIKFVEI